MGIKSWLGRILASVMLKLLQNGSGSFSSTLEVPEGPRSLNACDRLYLPQIQKDFPDYDNVLAKNHLRSHLSKLYADKSGFQLHKIAIAGYLPAGVSKTILFQAAVSWQDHGKTLQKRLNIRCSYCLPGSNSTVAANCPNCAGALGYGQLECSYCGCRITSPFDQAWQVLDISES